MLTQKNAATFDQQTQTRLMETHLLSLATAEIERTTIMALSAGL
jgi:hypothetical protein